MKKSYVVRVKSPSDWSEIHNLLLLDGTLEDNIPSRACECVDAKEVYDNRATYLLDDDEVELLRQNTKVKYVELDPSIHPEADLDIFLTEFETNVKRFENPVKLYRGVNSIVPASSPPKNTTATLDGEVIYNSSVDWENNNGNTVNGLNLDVSYYAGGGPRPTVIGIHGGLFFGGDKDDFDQDTQGLGSDKGKFFTDLGFNYISLNYRLCRNANLISAYDSGTGTVDPASIDFTDAAWTGRIKGEAIYFDLANAIDVIVSADFARKYGIDTENLVLFGHSAGAWLASLIATKGTLVDSSIFKGVISLDTTNFDLTQVLSNTGASETDASNWGFMNAWGVNPTINTIDFPNELSAQGYWDGVSPYALASDTSKAISAYAQNFCIITRGTATKVADNKKFADKLIERGVPTTYLSYRNGTDGSISGNRTGSGTITYTLEDIHKAIGHNNGDLENTDDDLVALGISNVTTEIANYLSSIITPLKNELNRTNWGLTRLGSKSRVWTNDEFVEHVNPYNNGNEQNINRYYSPLVKNLNIYHEYDQDGENIDCVVIDNGAWHGHPEFVDENGVSQIKDIILDGPFYIDPQYFISNSKTTNYLGRTTCTETAAKEWWTDSTKRSSSFSSVPTLSTGTIPTVYTRAEMCGSYSAYPSHVSVESSFANHGTPCASSVYGKNFGWAYKANKWNVAGNCGFNTVINVEKIYEILKIFVENKPLVSGIKYPTVISTSYVTATTVANQFTPGSYWYQYRSEAIGTFSDKATAPNFLKNFADGTYSNALYGAPTTNQAHQDAGDDLANLEGVIWIASAGNANQNVTKPGDLDHDNYWTDVDPNGGSFDPSIHRYFVNRRSSPGNFGYNSVTNEYNVLYAGALSAFLDDNYKEGKDWYSNSGTGVDFLSPASGVLAAAGNTSQESFTRYDSQDFYSWLNKEAYDTEIGGTSTAAPVFAGFIASKLSDLYYWGVENVRKYVRDLMKSQVASSFESGPGLISDSNSTDWWAVNNLFGQTAKIPYNEKVTNIPITQNLTEKIEVNQSAEGLILEVKANAPLVDIYSYQWESSKYKDFGFSAITGATSNTYTIASIDDSTIDRYYRLKISSDGPYRETYSVAGHVVYAPTIITITKQPVGVKATQGQSIGLKVTAETTSLNPITYQWQKYNALIDNYEDIAGETFSSLLFEDIQEESKGEYRCILNDGISPFVTSDIAKISVTISKLKFTLEPNNFTTFVGKTIDLVSAVSSTTNSTVFFQWQFNPNSSNKNDINWKNILEEKGASLTLSDLKSSDAGFYRCRATDNISINSPLYSSAAKVVVDNVILTVNTLDFNTSLIEGKELLLQVSATLNDGRLPTFNFQKRLITETGVQNLKEGVEYVIKTVGTTDFTTIGASNNLVGTVFTATGPGTGTGIVDRITWNLVDVNNTGQFYIQKISEAEAGRYRCVIEDSLASNSPQIVQPIDVSVLPSFEVNAVTSSPALVGVDEEVSLTPDVRIFNEDLAYYYIWERKENGSDEWEVINTAQSKIYTFIATGKDYLDKFRCRVFNNLGKVIYSNPDFQLSFNPFVDVTKELQERISFKENSQQIHILEPEVVSSHLSTVTYIWQKSLDYVLNSAEVQVPNTWEDISNETNKAIELTPQKIISLNSGNTDDFYFVRLKINFGQTGTHIFSQPTRIDLKDVFNLFGDCLSKEAADNLYSTDLRDNRNTHGNESLPDRQYLETINVDPVGPTDKCKDKNTCGISIKELFDTYPIYSTQKGLYKSWGDIEFPWQLEEARLRDLTPKPLPSTWDSLLWDSPGTTCNLNIEVDYTTGQGPNPPSDPAGDGHPANYIIDSTIAESSETNDKWQVAQYKALYAYFPKIGSSGLSSPPDATCLTERPADRVLRIEDDGFRVCLYEAQELVTALSGPFDKTKWAQICCITTSIPAGLPTPEEIKNRYLPYDLDFFLDEWEEYNATWDEDFYQQSFDQCRNTNSILADVEKCLKEKTGPFGQSDDTWENARIRKEFFYRVGDYAWIEGECKDTVCLYICIRDIPATEDLYNKLKQFKIGIKNEETQRFDIIYWEKVYCVNTGMNKCLEPQRERDLPNYQLVELGSLGHYVEQPVPFFDLEGNKLCNDFDLLNDVVEAAPPKTLTQEEIDALDQP